jgi:hypothetical protein
VGDRRGNAGEEGDAAMLSVVADEQARAELRVDLDELAREGARRMLAAALEAEVDDYLAEHAAERDEHGRRLVVRNGHARQREVTTAAGAISVRAPRVDDRRTDPVSGERMRFRSVILPSWTAGPTASTSGCGWSRPGCAAWWPWACAPTAPRSWWRSPTASGESTDSWAELLRDLRRRGMQASVGGRRRRRPWAVGGAP